MSDTSSLVVYVDVDDTLIRTFGSKRIPVSGVAQHVVSLFNEGMTLYCWSSGGADYARKIAGDLGIAHCFVGFLPKPNVIIDDQDLDKWRYLIQVHPGVCTSISIERYREIIDAK